MAMVINSNIMSLTAQRNLTMSQNDLNTSMERLTSGKRINSAADDAAGLSIANRMTSQINGLNQAVRNANDGASLIQTAEGALDESTNILQRMRELSVQSANGTYDSGNRATLNAEVKQLKEELDRISSSTSFNGLNILDGTLGKVDLQVGSESNQTITLEIGKMDSKSLGGNAGTGDLVGAQSNLSALVIGDGDIKINGQNLSAFDGTGTDTLSNLLDDINSIAGVEASAISSIKATTAGEGLLQDSDSITIAMTNPDGTSQSFTVKNTSSLEELATKINETTGNTLRAEVDSDGKMILSSDIGASFTVTDTTGALGAGINGTAVEAQLILSSDSGELTIETANAGTLADLANMGLRSVGDGEVRGVALSNPDTAFNAGDLKINGVAIGATNTDSIQGKINAINAASSETGVIASTYSQMSIDMTAVDESTLVGGAISLNGVDVTIAANSSLNDIADDFNAATEFTGVTVKVSGDSLIFEGTGAMTFGDDSGASGVFLEGALTDGGANTPTVTSNTSVSSAIGTADATETATGAFTIEVGMKLTSLDGGTIQIDLSDTDANGARLRTGFVESNVSTGGSFGSNVASIDISTAAGAQKAISTIDTALEQINTTRGDLGAVSNRLDFTVNNLSNVSENVSAARSRIEDADFAAESANLSRAQVLQQAGTAMLAQANAAPQQVLSLLQ